jgi:hypothetical protein
MQRNKKYKTYPFPYLADFSNDYKKSNFNLEIGYKFEKGTIDIKANYSITNDEILSSLKDDTLIVALKIVCTTMGYSKTIPFKKDRNDMAIHYNSLALDGEVYFTAYLVAKRDFSFQNSDFSSFWFNESPVVNAGNVIGESNERILTINHLKSGTKKSIFKFIRDTAKEDKEPFSYSLDKDVIVFKLNKSTFNAFNSIKNKNEEFVYVSFLIPVMIDILRQMINIEIDEENDEVQTNDFNLRHSNNRWYVVITDIYRKAFDGKDPTKNDIDPLKAAQIIIDKYAVHNIVCSAKKLG